MPPAITASEITDITLDGPLYFTEQETTNGCRLDYHHYSIPACASPKAWAPMTETITFTTFSNGASIQIPGNYVADDHYSTTDIEIFKQEIHNNTSALIEEYDRRRRYEYQCDTSLPDRVRTVLEGHGKTLGDALRRIHENWEHLHQFGPKRVKKILYTDLNDTGTPDNHDDVAMVACSDCGEPFWQFIPNNLKLNYLHTHDVYCPICYHNVSQQSYISHERIPVKSFLEPDPQDTYPPIAPHEANPHLTTPR